MAKNVDEITLKVGVEGASSLDDVNTKLGNIDKSTKSASDTLKAFNIRNVSYQVQDLAVQLSMGTNAFIAIGQQLPQLLSGFGTTGAVIGAVAAVAIPLLQQGLKAAGVDMRNLAEMTKDLTKANEDFLNAQKQNQVTLAGMGASYGILTDEAKKFFEVKEKLSQAKAERETIDTVNELKKSYQDLSRESVAAARAQVGIGPGAPGAAEIGVWFRQWRKGLTEEQGYAVAEMLKEIDAASPEKTVNAINNVLIYLEKAGPEAKKFKETFEKTVEPLMKVNEELIKNKTNIKEAAERASELNAKLMEMQTPALADINAAKRNFDQVTAIRKEGELKYQEFKSQIDERTNQDGVNREKELAAFRLKNNQEVSDKIKDFAKGQYETYRAASLTNDAKTRQLGLEGEILGLQEEGKLSALNIFQLNEDILRNAYNYNEALKTLDEQRRKNLITVGQQTKLEKEAADIRIKSDELAYQALEARQRAFISGQKQIIGQDARRLELFNSTATLSDRERKNAEAIFQINEERQKQLLGLQSLNDPILRASKEKEINDIYDERIKSTQRQQEADKSLMDNFASGWERSYANYVESSKNAFEKASSLFNKVTKSMEDTLLNFFKTGKLGWKDFVQTIIDELMRSQIQQLVAKIMAPSVGRVGGSGGLLGGAIIPGILAGGGPAAANTPYIVGERGPELFVPASNGTMVPNSGIGGSTNVVYNISAVDAQSFKQMLAKDPSFLYAVTEQGRRTLPGAA